MKTRFIKTDFGWAAYIWHGRAYVYFGHFYTQREARAALKLPRFEHRADETVWILGG